MTTKIISTVYENGYVLAPQYNVVKITQRGTIYGTLQLHHTATVDNNGALYGGHTENGVTATDGGLIANLSVGQIIGYSGVFAQNARATVDNFDYIGGRARYGDGVFLTAGGYVRNESDANIYGDNGGIVLGAAGSVANFGGIYATHGQGVDLAAGGSVVNGSRDANAYIDSAYSQAVMIGGGAGVVTNYGGIEALAGPAGIYLAAGGTITNTDDAAIEGRGPNSVGVYAKGAAAQILNAGEIISDHYSAVVLRDGGTLANTGAIYAGAGEPGAYFAVLVSGAGVVTNGSSTGPDAIIRGSVYLETTGSVNNFASIVSGGGTGVYVATGSVTNGSTAQPGALIEGYYVGVRVGADTTVTNFGIIEGQGGFAPKAIEMSASDTLVAEAGCAFIGQVLGGGGVLDLAGDVAGGTGQLGFAAGGTVTAAGSAATTFSNFGVVEIAPGATFSTLGAPVLSAGESLIVSGVLTLGAKKSAVTNDGVIETAGGALSVAGKVSGAGSAAVDGGQLAFAAAFSQDVSFTGKGTLELAMSQSYKGTLTGFSGKGADFLDLDDIAFTGVDEASFSGNKKAGVLTVTDGTHTARISLTGNYASLSFVAADDGHGGVIIHAMPAPAPAPHGFIDAMAALGARPEAFGLQTTLASPPSTRLEVACRCGAA